PFERLRRLGKLCDVRILTKEGHEVVAHRLLLATRFPHIEEAVMNCTGGTLKWQRYGRDIVEAVVKYAYTGSIDISLDNALRLYLVATNLGCVTLATWCIEYLESRISRDNVGCIWSVGDATKNKDMMKLCVPVIAAHFDSIDSIQPNFYASTDLANLATLLTDSRLGGVMEDSKLLAVATWFEARRTAPEEVEEEGKKGGKTFVDVFIDLVAAIDLGKITSDQFVDICTSKCWMHVPEECRDLVVNSWKEARAGELSKDCLTAFRREDNNLSFSTFEWMTGVTRIDASPRCVVPSRFGCAVVALNDSIYLIGGVDEMGPPTNKVDRVNPSDGRVSSVAPMVQARWDCTAVANGQQIFVFGGIECENAILSSCEKFDPATNRWTPLPDMPTARDASGAVYVPDIGFVVVGGYSDDGEYVNTAELLTVTSEVDGHVNSSWRQLPPMLEGREGPAVAYFRGHVIVAESNPVKNISVESLRLSRADNDPGQWTRLSGLGKGNGWPTSLVVYNDSLLLSGMTFLRYCLTYKDDIYRC
uniref:BTB domain-containing protein n=1 Tax=Mesocestoides corti TaxID=53468 RepID=A0A5K3FIU3_MESCO